MTGLLNFLLGFRKFIMAAAFILISVVLLALGQVDGKTLVETSRDVVVAFMGTNLGEHLISTTQKWIESRQKA